MGILLIKNEDLDQLLAASECICLCLTPGAGSLRAKFELSNGPSNPSTLAVQFMSDGSTLSGVDMELLGSGYRLSLNKKRFATGRQVHPNVTDTGIINASATHASVSFRTLHGRLLR